MRIQRACHQAISIPHTHIHRLEPAAEEVFHAVAGAAEVFAAETYFGFGNVDVDFWEDGFGDGVGLDHDAGGFAGVFVFVVDGARRVGV